MTESNNLCKGKKEPNFFPGFTKKKKKKHHKIPLWIWIPASPYQKTATPHPAHPRHRPTAHLCTRHRPTAHLCTNEGTKNQNQLGKTKFKLGLESLTISLQNNTNSATIFFITQIRKALQQYKKGTSTTIQELPNKLDKTHQR
ncbi:hypothetical protein Dimus_006280 [Dionaea muscipula]